MEELSAGARYCVVDLSGGPDAASYPVQYLDAEPAGGFNTDEYKTAKLVLRRIDAGTFVMGDPSVPDNQPHVVTLTRVFYIGIFEVTLKQWELVTGWNPSYFSQEDWYAKHPADCIYFEDIRGRHDRDGKTWPESSGVSYCSFLGLLRARTGIDFDLPTEAQWEYACRAGTTTLFSYGDEILASEYRWGDHEHDVVKGSETHEVGQRKPNGFGLYDMYGNATEWCVDWYGELAEGTDPIGAATSAQDRKGWSMGSGRVWRGGPCSSSARRVESDYEEVDENDPAGICDFIGGIRETYANFGFRLVWTMPLKKGA